MAADATIKGIEFQVIGEAKSAQDSLSALASTLKRLKQTIGGGLGMNTLVKNLEKLSNVSNNVNTENIKKLASALKSFGKIEINPAAAKSIKEVAKAFSGFNMKKMAGVAESMSALAKLKGFGSENFKSGMASLVYGLQQIQGMDLSNLEKAGAAAKDLADAFRQGQKGKGKEEPLTPKPPTDVVPEYINAFDAIFAAIKQLVGKAAPLFAKLGSLMKSAVGGLARGAGKAMIMPFANGIEKIKGYGKALGGVLSGFKRIVGYRIIRSIIREITQGFSEGVKNLYGWSNMVGGKFASSMDQITTSMLYLKNSIAAAVAPIVNALAPAIDFLIDKVVALLNVLNQLFAKLSGATSWTRAQKKATEYGEAVGGAGAAAKEALKYLAPFDELNVLPSDKNGGGGGGGGSDYSDMFEEVSEFNEAIANFADMIKEKVNAGDWQGLGTLLGNKVNDIIDMIDFAGLGTKVGTAINALFTTKYWTFQTINFTNIGTQVATFLNNALSEIDFDIVGRSLTQWFTNLGDFVLGAVQTVDWHQVGQSIGNLMRGAFSQVSEWMSGIDWGEVGRNIPIWIGNAIDGLDVDSLANSIWNLLKGAVDAAIGLLSGLGQWLFGGGSLEIKMSLTNAIGSIGAWIKSEIIDPIVGAFNDFVANHPTIAKLLGFPGASGGGTTINAGEFGGISGTVSIDAEANVTSVKDSIPEGKKTLKGWLADIVNQTYENLPWNKRKLTEQADIVSQTVENLPWSNRKIREGADIVAQSYSNLPWANRKIAEQADIVSQIYSNLPWAKRKLTEQADIVSQVYGNLPWDKRTITEQADFRGTIDNLSSSQKTLSTYAQMINAWWKSGLSWETKTFDSYAQMIDAWWKGDTPTLPVYASLILDYDTNNPGYVMGSSASGGIWGARGKIADIPQYARGGRVHGSLFLAGEAGAEVVGHVGGRTEVLNRSQLASTMYAAVRSAMSDITFNVSAPSMATGTADDGTNEDMLYRAFLRALNDSDVADRPIELDGNTLYNSMVTRNRRNTRLTGVNAMA